ncbi:alpha/beta hydrolase family protein [Novosphingobium sediminis]|nr:alpha/beta fold hydrolase [Novosphingobium sediminis]
MRAWMAMAGVAAAALAAGMAQAEDGAEVAAKFGALESVRQISLSTDGTKIAFIAPQDDGGARLMVADLAGDGVPKAILAQRPGPETLRSCSWVLATRLVCRNSVVYDYGGLLLPISRLFVLDSDGNNVKRLSAGTGSDTVGAVSLTGGSVIDWSVPGKPGHVLLTRFFVPQQAAQVGIKRDVSGFGVEDVDVTSLQRFTLERPVAEADEYISDGQGTVRIMAVAPRDAGGESRGQISYSFRMPGSREWKSLSRVTMNAAGRFEGFRPAAIDPARNLAYGFQSVNGAKALYTMALDGTGKQDLVLAREGVDVDELITIGRNQRVVGASYATDRRLVEFFDPALKKLGAGLAKALPGQPSITFIDSSDDGKLLMLASSDVDPGMFYRYDPATHQLAPLLPMRAQLQGVAMGEMKSVTYPAADGTMIPAYLTLPPGSSGKNLPAIVMPHGGPSSRDEWGFDWLVQFFAVRGYAVLQPNFRGSSGYGSDWYQRNGFQSWRTAIGDVNDAGRWLQAQGIAAKGKLAIVGWSYGGYAALQSSVLDPDLFKAIVAVAPVTDLQRLRTESSRLGRTFIGEGSQVVTDGSPALNASRIKAPVLLFHGDRDINVDIGHSREMEDRLRAAGTAVTLVTFPGLDHQLVSSTARTRLLADSDAFLRKALGL